MLFSYCYLWSNHFRGLLGIKTIPVFFLYFKTKNIYWLRRLPCQKQLLMQIVRSWAGEVPLRRISCDLRLLYSVNCIGTRRLVCEVHTLPLDRSQYDKYTSRCLVVKRRLVVGSTSDSPVSLIAFFHNPVFDEAETMPETATSKENFLNKRQIPLTRI